jgi:hypothetical protein
VPCYIVSYTCTHHCALLHSLIQPDSDVIEEPMEPGSVESVEFIVFLPCKDQWLSKDQVYYTRELEKFEEIERVVHTTLPCYTA